MSAVGWTEYDALRDAFEDALSTDRPLDPDAYATRTLRAMGLTFNGRQPHPSTLPLLTTASPDPDAPF